MMKYLHFDAIVPVILQKSRRFICDRLARSLLGPKAYCFMFAFFSLMAAPNVCDAQAGAAAKAFSVGAKLLAGAMAADSMRRAGNASVEFFYSSKDAEFTDEQLRKLREQKIENMSRQFESQNLTSRNLAIYSVFLNIDYNASSVYWADTFSKPDVFFFMEVEGVGQFVLPEIYYEYKGGPVMASVVLPALPAGARVIIRVLDDDTTSDRIWKSILASRVNYRFSINNTTVTPVNLMAVNGTVYGDFRLLDNDSSLVLDGPDQLATMVFSIPENPGPTWVADGELRDYGGYAAGRVQFSQVWNTASEISALEAELAAKKEVAKSKMASSLGWILFWGVIVFFCLHAYFRLKIAKVQMKDESKPTQAEVG